MKTPLTPLREQILVEVEEQDEVTSGGIFIPEIARQKQRRAKVIAVGTGWYDDKTGKLKPLGVSPGDRIFIGTNFKGIDLTFNKKKYELIRENYIFGIVK